LPACSPRWTSETREKRAFFPRRGRSPRAPRTTARHAHDGRRRCVVGGNSPISEESAGPTRWGSPGAGGAAPTVVGTRKRGKTRFQDRGVRKRGEVDDRQKTWSLNGRVKTEYGRRPRGEERDLDSAGAGDRGLHVGCRAHPCMCNYVAPAFWRHCSLRRHTRATKATTHRTNPTADQAAGCRRFNVG